MVFFALILASLWLCPGQVLALVVGPGPAPAPETFLRTHYSLPERISFCGTEVPLHDPEVREDLDMEFTIILWNRTQTTLWLKRAARFFPHIEQRLREHKLPDDLKYVALVESDLRLPVRSPAGASGPWQFMKPAANRFNLKTEDTIDDRFDFLRSTEAALQYLKALHRMFNNWPLAVAAYNCGEGRLQRTMREQGVNSYYHLDLPEETNRYVLRIIAAKIILSEPHRYGFDIPPEDLYRPLQPDQVEFVLDQEIHLRQVAEACGSYYKLIRRLNPRFRTATLPPGIYRLNVPAGTASRFYEAYLQGRFGRPERKPAENENP